LNKAISVRISSNVGGALVVEDINMSARYYNAETDEFYDEGVTYATNVTAYPSGDFVPCTAFVPFDAMWQQKNQGRCLGTKGQFNGELRTDPGTTKGKVFDSDTLRWIEVDMSNSFWAHRDIKLPPKTFMWTWGVTDAWSRGIEGQAEFENYPLFGSTFVGLIPYATQNPRVDFMNQIDAYSWFDISPVVPFRRTQDPETTACYSELSGPMAPFQITDQNNETFCATGFSGIDTISRGTGRIVMGTYGNESLGTRFTFGVGIVVALHE
jgi:hypothetical protein